MNDQLSDAIVAAIVTECLLVMQQHTYDTRTKMTACYNLMERILRLFAVCGEKEDILALLNDFHAGIKKEVNRHYRELDKKSES